MSDPIPKSGISEVVSVGFDEVAIRHVIDALKSGDFGQCRAPQLLHAAKALDWLLRADVLLDGNLGPLVEALVDLREGAMNLTPRIAVSKALTDHDPLGSVWADEVHELLEANRSPDGFQRIVDRLQRKHGLSKTEAMREVAERAGIQFESVKKTLQRLRKRKS